MMIRSLVLFGCFVAGAGLVARAERPEPAPVRTSFAAFPMELDEWVGAQQPPLDPEIRRVLGVDDYLTRIYMRQDHAAIGLYVGYYGSQRQGDTMHSPQNCLPGAGWEPVSNAMMPITVATTPSGPPTTQVVNRYVIRKGLDRQLVLYWYQSHGRVTASEYWAKFYLIRDAIRLNRTDGALVRVITPITGEDEEAEQTALRFVDRLFPVLDKYLPS